MAEICNPYSRRYTRSTGLFKSPSDNLVQTRMRPLLRKRTFENITPYQRQDLINWSWGIYGKIPNLRAALKFKTNFACSDGCYVEYHGANKPWGRAMESSINEIYYGDCNLQGLNHDFHATLAEVSIALETHGQVGWVFDLESGKVKLISASCIGNGMSLESKSGAVYELGTAAGNLSYWGLSNVGTGGYGNLLQLMTGAFSGNYLIDGVIVTRNMVTLGYRILGFDAEGKPSYADLPISQMGLIFEPDFIDQVMGYPGLSPLIEAVGTVDDWNYYIGQAMKLSAAMAVTRKSKDGRPAGGGVSFSTISEPTTDGGTSKRIVAHEIVQAGLVELATENNEEIQTVPFSRPSMNEEEFIKRFETGFFAEHWPREFIHTEGFGRAASRIGVVQARQIVWKRHKTLARFGKQWIQRRIAWEMSKGLLPENNNFGDAYLISISAPAEISCDEGNDAKIDYMALSRGGMSHREICAKNGRSEERVENETNEKRGRLMDKAIALSNSKMDAAGKPIWTPKEVLLMFDNMDSNISFSDSTSTTPDDTTQPPAAPGQGEKKAVVQE